MALFEYQAISDTGRKKTGIIDADSLADAKLLLHKKNVLSTSVFPIKKKIKTLSKKDVLGFTSELCKLMKASLPLYEALYALYEKYEKNNLKLLILDVCDKIKSGFSLSKALSSHSSSFDILFCSMIENAEKTGSLTQCLEEISQMLEKRISLKRKLIASLTYPAILGAFCVLIISALLFYIVPSLFELFEGKDLHPLTKIVLSLSFFVSNMKIYLIIAFISLVTAVSVVFNFKPAKMKLYKIILSLPIIKSLMIKVALVRFFRSFSSLLTGGVTYLNAYTLSINVMRHPALEETFFDLKEKIIEGRKLSDLIKEIDDIPPLVYRMLAIAEEASGMNVMLNNIAKIYEDELEKMLLQITSIIQPVMLIILGIIVGFIVLSVLLPLTDVSSFMEG